MDEQTTKTDLARELQARVGNIPVKPNYRIIPSEGNQSPQADICIDHNANQVFVELEVHQPCPETNVVKYWRWVDQYRITKTITIIQAFGPIFKETKSNYVSRKRSAIFLGEKIQSLAGIGYHALDMDEPSERSLSELAVRITDYCRSSLRQ